MLSALRSATEGLRRQSRAASDAAEGVQRATLGAAPDGGPETRANDGPATTVTLGEAGQSLPDALVSLRQARHGYGANLAVIRSVDEALGTLVDAPNR